MVASGQTEGVKCQAGLAEGRKGEYTKGRAQLSAISLRQVVSFERLTVQVTKSPTCAGRPRSSRKCALYTLFTLFVALAMLLTQLLRSVSSGVSVHSAHLLAAQPARPTFRHRCNMLLSWYELSSNNAAVTISRSSKGRRYGASVDAEGVVQAIWQTAKLRSGVPAMVACYTASWNHYNPGWTHEVLDDADMFAIMADKYDTAFMDKFRALPLGVMRADVFRCGATRATAAAGAARSPAIRLTHVSAWLCDC